MSQTVSVSRIAPAEWQSYKRLRLNALEQAPDAFGSTFEETVRRADSSWQARLRDAHPAHDLPLFGRVDGNPVGLAWGMLDADKHADAYLFQMWVDPGCRGKGVGRALLAATIQWARNQRAARLLLSVTVDDSPAWRMYAAAGFVAQGAPEPLREGTTLIAQPMALSLHPQAAQDE